jgi:hypothetical protein
MKVVAVAKVLSKPVNPPKFRMTARYFVRSYPPTIYPDNGGQQRDVCEEVGHFHGRIQGRTTHDPKTRTQTYDGAASYHRPQQHRPNREAGQGKLHTTK